MESHKYTIEVENGVIKLYLHEGILVDVTTLIQIQNELEKIKNSNPIPLLVFADIGSNTTQEVNDILLKDGKVGGDDIVAVVVKNLAGRINANYYKNISKTSKRVEVFSSEKDALSWINEIQNKNT